MHFIIISCSINPLPLLDWTSKRFIQFNEFTIFILSGHIFSVLFLIICSIIITINVFYTICITTWTHWHITHLMQHHSTINLNSVIIDNMRNHLQIQIHIYSIDDSWCWSIKCCITCTFKLCNTVHQSNALIPFISCI